MFECQALEACRVNLGSTWGNLHRGLHSSTSWLNVSAFGKTGGTFRGRSEGCL